MSEEEAFLQQLEERPADDTTRLVYADWLDERDRPGGEFLRNAVALRALAPHDTRAARLRHRILELRPDLSTGWLVRAFREYAEDDVREAALRHGYKDDGFNRHTFLSADGNDPTWYLLDRLLPDYPNLWPVSKGVGGGERLSGTYCMLDGPKWIDRDHCEIDFGVAYAPLMGHGVRYRLEMRADVWTVTDEENTWIS